MSINRFLPIVLILSHTHWFTGSTGAVSDVVRIGCLFTEDEKDGLIESAFKYAVYRINKDRMLLPNTTLVYDIQYINKDDSFHASKKACHQVASGVVAIIGPQDPLLGSHVQSLCDAMDIPHLEFRIQHLAETPSIPSSLSSFTYPISSPSGPGIQSVPMPLASSSVSSGNGAGKEFSINLHPNSRAISDSLRELIVYLNWTDVAVIYDQDISLIALQELLKPPPLPKNVQFVFRKSHPDVFRETLHDIRARNIFSMIVDLKPESVPAFVTAILQVQMNDYRYHYHLTSFDIEIFDLENMKYNFVNMTAFRLVDSTNSMVRHVLRDMERFQPKGKPILNRTNVIQAGPALMFDSVYSLAKGVHSLQKSAPRSILRSSNASCESETPWLDGSSLYNYINSVQFQGLTGRVQFKEGLRSYVKWDLLKLREQRLEKVGEWSNVGGLNITNNNAFHEFGVKNITLKITTILVKPYIMERVESNLTGNDRYEGFCIDLMRTVAEKLGFQYELYLVPDGKFGVEDPENSGSWNGLVRELIDKQADLALAPMTINFARESVIDFTKPFMNLGIGILFKLPSTMPTRLFSFMSPLAVDIWLYVLLAYVCVSCTMFIVARFSPYEWINPHPCVPDSDVVENQFSLSNSFWFTIVTLMHQGCDINPKSASTRIIGAIWWFFTLIIISSYTANLAAFLTVERMITPIESVEDLAAQSKIQYGTLESGSTMTFFRDSNIDTYHKMWMFMDNRKDVFVKTYEEGVERVREGNYAFLMESTMIDYMVQRDCNLTQIGGLIDSKGYGIATPVGSPWRDAISLAILDLQEKGIIQMLYNKWWKTAGLTCNRDEKGKEGKANALGVANIGGVFVVLLVGLVVAIMIAIMEFVCHSKKTAQSQRQSLCTEMAEELRFAMKCQGSRKRPALRRTCSKCGVSPLGMDSTYVPAGVNMIPQTDHVLRCHPLPPPPPPLDPLRTGPGFVQMMEMDLASSKRSSPVSSEFLDCAHHHHQHTLPNLRLNNHSRLNHLNPRNSCYQHN